MRATKVIVCTGGNDYEFEGWRFEYHRYLGPWPLNKDGSPRETPPGRKFFDMFERFYALTEKEKQRFLVRRGGCIGTTGCC